MTTATITLASEGVFEQILTSNLVGEETQNTPLQPLVREELYSAAFQPHCWLVSCRSGTGDREDFVLFKHCRAQSGSLTFPI